MKNKPRYKPYHRPWYRRSGKRPDWWPDEYDWPPPWQGSTFRRFFRRMVLFFGLVIILGGISCVTLAYIFISGQPWQELQPERLWTGGLIFLVLAVIGSFLAIRRLRRETAPVDDILDTADRLARGDLSARVTTGEATEFHALRDAINAMASRLEDDARQRRDLLAEVTHELRTPLTYIRGTLEGMLDDVYPRDDERLQAMLEETAQLSSLLEDLHTLALAERGALQLRPELTDLPVLAGETLAAVEAQAKSAGVSLELVVENDPPLVEVDPLRLRQVLQNLLANALRYTPEGGEVRVEVAEREGYLVLRVADSGSGIAADHLPHIFDRFYRIDDTGGSGLGLAICKDLVEAHDGTIEAQSEPGEGTIVTVRLPR
jgi:two-component system sensor histidine kinase BaeS